MNGDSYDEWAAAANVPKKRNRKQRNPAFVAYEGKSSGISTTDALPDGAANLMTLAAGEAAAEPALTAASAEEVMEEPAAAAEEPAAAAKKPAKPSSKSRRQRKDKRKPAAESDDEGFGSDDTVEMDDEEIEATGGAKARGGGKKKAKKLKAKATASIGSYTFTLYVLKNHTGTLSASAIETDMALAIPADEIGSVTLGDLNLMVIEESEDAIQAIPEGFYPGKLWPCMYTQDYMLFYRVAGSKKLQRLDIIGKDTIEDTILTSYRENEPANSVIQLAAMFCEKKKKKEDAPAGAVVAGKALVICFKNRVYQTENSSKEIEFKTEGSGFTPVIVNKSEDIDALNDMETARSVLARLARDAGLSIPTGDVQPFIWEAAEANENIGKAYPITSLSHLQKVKLTKAVEYSGEVGEVPDGTKGMLVAMPFADDSTPAVFPHAAAPYPMKGQAYHYVPVRVPVNARAGGAAAKQSKQYEMANKISAVEVAAAVVERQPPYPIFTAEHKQIWVQQIGDHEIPHPQDPACGGKPVQPDWPKLVALVAPPKHGHGPPAPQMTARGHAAASTASVAQMQQLMSLRMMEALDRFSSPAASPPTAPAGAAAAAAAPAIVRTPSPSSPPTSFADYLQNMKQIKESEESGILSKEEAEAARNTEKARYHGSPVKVSP